MNVQITDPLRNEFLLKFGIDESAVIAVAEKPLQTSAIALDAGNESVAIFAGRPNWANPGHILLVAGKLAGEEFFPRMAFKIPEDLIGPGDDMNPPLQILEDFANRFGLGIIIGAKIGKFIVNERIPVSVTQIAQGPSVANAGNAKFFLSWMVRFVTEAGQSYADCSLCFAINIDAYLKSLSETTEQKPPSRIERVAHKISLTINQPAKDLMRMTGLSTRQAETTLSYRHQEMLIPGGENPRMFAIHWFENGQIAFLQGVVTKMRIQGNVLWLDAVETQLILALRPDLPGGKLDRGKGMDDLLPCIAGSFGAMLCCHPDHGFSKLYSGPWDGLTPRIQAASNDPVLLSGTFNPITKSCNSVWACSLNSYQRWWKEGSPGRR